MCQGQCLAGAGVGHGGWLLVTGTLAQGPRVSYPIPGKLRGSGKYSRGLRKSWGAWLAGVTAQGRGMGQLLRRRARRESVAMNHRAAQPVRDPTGLSLLRSGGSG